MNLSQWLWEKVLWYSSPFLSVLAVIWVWYWVKVAVNSPKYTKIIRIISKVIEKFSKNPEMIQELWKNEKVMQMLEMMKWMVPNVDRLLLRLKTQKEISLIDSQTISKLSDEEIIAYIHKNNIEHIDISKLWSKELARINYIITNNFPLVEISRLIPWEKLININISWIKQINDSVWQEFCDKVISVFKDILKNNFHKTNSWIDYKWRIVKNDYKNITFVTHWEKPLELIFWKITTKDEIIRSILQYLEKDIVQNAKYLLTQQLKKWEISITSQKHFEKLLEQKVNETKEVVQKNFDFGVWEFTIPKDSDTVMKLDSIRKAEISSRVWVQRENSINLKHFDKTELIESISNALDGEKLIIEKYKWQKFTFEWISYNVIYNNNWNFNISTELLRYVRKYPEKIQPKELVDITKTYINNLNQSLDFISPVKWDLLWNNADFLKAKDINTQIQSWILDSSFLKQGFKWWLNKSAFFAETQNTPGIKIFLDIKDMWIDNLVDFNLRAKKIIQLEKDFKSGKIDKKIFEDTQTRLFLEAWKSVSDKFIEIQKRVMKKYPEAKISFGWDEIYLFIPEKKSPSIEEIQWTLNNIMSASNQKARIVIDASMQTWNSKETYSKLEKITKINKILEENIEKQCIQKWQNIHGNIPNNTFVTINNSLREIIMKSNFNIENFLITVKNTLEKEKLTWIWKKDISLWENWKGIKISFIKEKNNTVQIYLHND